MLDILAFCKNLQNARGPADYIAHYMDPFLSVSMSFSLHLTESLGSWVTLLILTMNFLSLPDDILERVLLSCNWNDILALERASVLYFFVTHSDSASSLAVN